MSRTVLVALALLAACASTPDADPVDQTAEPTPDPLSDADGDGLTWQEEVAGWTISVNRTGYWQDSQTELVTSDPDLADSDGDGLDDLQERLHKSDPTLPDTDFDGLTDAEEVHRFGTSPSQVDTDGDARGADPRFPAPPRRALFDGDELLLETVDGRRVPGLGATSPLLADTDGDGYTDYEELAVPQRDPVVAELPRISIEPTPYSALDLSLDVVYASGQGSTTRHGSSLSWGSSREWARSTTKGLSFAQDVSLYIAAQATVAAGNNVSGSFEVDERVTSRTRFGASYVYQVDRNQATTSAAEHQRYQQRSSRESTEVVGGQVQMLVDVQNTGRRTYLVQGMGLVLYHQRDGRLEPAAYLTPTIPDFTLGPGERATGLMLADDDVDPGTVAELMRNPHTIVLGSPTFDLVDKDGLDFAYVDETVFERTSHLTVDLPGGVVDVDVASHVDRTDDGEVVGLTIADALDLAEIGYELREGTNPTTGDTELRLVIEGIEPEYHEGELPDFSLYDVLGYPYSGGPGIRAVRADWYAIIERHEGGGEETLPVLETRLFPGDTATLVFARDDDRDGLIDLEELVAGSSDHAIDSDRTYGRPDLLSDFYEVREGWVVQVEGREPYRVFPGPAAKDADADGLLDDQEAEAGTDPNLADTDGDGFSDLGELSAVGLDLDPLRPDAGGDLSITCSLSDIPGEYLIEATSSIGRPLLTYDAKEHPDDDHRCTYGVGGLTEVQGTETTASALACIPIAIRDWRGVRPVATVVAGGSLSDLVGLGRLSVACPAP